jgi:hypothetical protein
MILIHRGPARLGTDDQRVPGCRGHHGHHPRRHRGHCRHRTHAHTHVEDIHDDTRQEGVCQVREGEGARKVGRGKKYKSLIEKTMVDETLFALVLLGRKPNLQVGHVNVQEPHLQRKVG